MHYTLIQMRSTAVSSHLKCGPTINLKNTVVIASGRDKELLQSHLGDLNVGLTAGYGVWVRPMEGPWHQMISERLEWKRVVLPIMEWFARRTSGSLVEVKPSGIHQSLSVGYRVRNPQEVRTLLKTFLAVQS